MGVHFIRKTKNPCTDTFVGILSVTLVVIVEKIGYGQMSLINIYQNYGTSIYTIMT